MIAIPINYQPYFFYENKPKKEIQLIRSHQKQDAKELKGYGQGRSLAFHYCFLRPSQTDFLNPLNFA